jgi:hypothetical protein
MDMVRHEAPSLESDAKPARLLCYKLKIAETIQIIRKDVCGTDAPLGNVVGIAWHNQAR